MPLMEAVLEQRYANQQVINRWNYLASGTPGGTTLSFGLLSAMGALPVSTTLPTGTVMGSIQALQSQAVQFVQMTVRAVYDDDDFYGSPFLLNTTGLHGGTSDSESPVMAFGFRSNRVKQSIRRGYKRFVGVTEDDTAALSVLASTVTTYLAAIKAAMDEVLSYDDEGSTLTYTPCIASKEEYTTPSGKTAYKYYATESAQAAHLAVGVTWEPYSQVRTQNSRQYGRGS